MNELAHNCVLSSPFHSMPGQISAKALWDTLRQRSTKVLEEMETETSQVGFKLWNIQKTSYSL